MKILKRNILIVLILVGAGFTSMAQEFSISAEYRPRVEYHDVILSPEGEAISLFTQRTRLKFDFSDITRGISARFTLQDARSWGNNNQFALVLQNSQLMPYEAWAEVKLLNKFSFKAGRQVIKYDDQRVFGENDFQQQSRSHDAVLLKYRGKFDLDFGVALNTSAVPLALNDEPYTLNNYKAMQFFHFHKDFKKLGLSLTGLNNGIEVDGDNDGDRKTVYSQTLGFHSEYKINKRMKATLLGYSQMGKDAKQRDLSAYNVKGELFVMAVPRKLITKLSYEVLSGNDKDSDLRPGVGENNSFNIMYGSAVKNFGLNSVYNFAPPTGNISTVNYGISYATLDLIYMVNKKLTLRNRLMSVGSLNTIDYLIPAGPQAGQRVTADGKHLGIENDLFVMYKLNDQVTFRGIAVFYSMTDNQRKLPHPKFELSKYDGSLKWFSLSCLITPEFFSTKKKK